MYQFDGWEITIGLEVHIQLLTKSKLFSGSSTAYGAAPNTQINAIDIGMPGALPVLNQEAVRMAVLFGLSVGATISSETVFSRKHYFYPDLPKGYQISQHDHPIVEKGGSITIATEQSKSKIINITRAHLEEDAGKSVHEGLEVEGEAHITGIDLNRAGVPLLEIVTEPDLSSAKEAVYFLKKLHRLVRYLKICDGNMQEGSFRCDANVSVRPKGSTQLGVRKEIKNLNSFKHLEDAINIEASNQIQAIQAGEILRSETRSYDPQRQQTSRLRDKEEQTDYRYMPDPDLCPVPLSKEFIQKIQHELPELPEAKYTRFQKEYKLSAYDAEILTENRESAEYFEAVVRKGVDAKLVASWMNGELAAALNGAKLSIDEILITPEQLAHLLKRVSDDTLSRATAKTIFERLWKKSEDIDAIIQKEGLAQLNDEKAIEALIDEVLRQNPKQLIAYRNGKVKLFGFFVGQAMKATQGRCHPGILNRLLKTKLDDLSSVLESHQ